MEIGDGRLVLQRKVSILWKNIWPVIFEPPGTLWVQHLLVLDAQETLRCGSGLTGIAVFVANFALCNIRD